MSDNVNVLIEKMNQESMKKRRAAGGPNARRAQAANANIGSNVSNAGASVSNQGDGAAAAGVAYDEEGRPVQGGVGAGLVPGALPNRGGNAGGGGGP